MDSELLAGALRLTVLEAAGLSFDARVERVSEKRILVACERTLEIGSAIQLDAVDRMLLAEVISLERDANETRALLEVQHAVLHADLEHIRFHLEPSVTRASAAGA